MNASAILKHLQTMAPDCIGLRIEEQGRGIYALHWNRNGMARTLIFSAAGVMGDWRHDAGALTDLQLASELAKAVRA